MSEASPLESALRDAVARRGDAWVGREAAQQALAVAIDDADARQRDTDELQLITRHFGLGEVDVRLLEVAAAAERSTALHLLSGLLSGDPGPARPTVALALELAGLPVDDRSARAHLANLAALVRFGLVEIDGPDALLSRRLRVPERVAAHLAGQDAPAAPLLPLLLEPIPVDVEGTTTVADAITAGHPLVWVHGPAGSAGAAMAAAACRKLDVPCLVADLRRLDGGADADAAVRALLLESGLGGAVLVLAGAERARGTAFEHAALPVVAVSVEAWDPTWAVGLPPTVTAPRLTLAERERVWRPVLGGQQVGRELSALRLGPEQILAVGRHARQMAALHGEADITLERVRSSARQLGRGRSTRADPDATTTLDDLVLPPHALAEIERMLDWARYRDEVVPLGSLYGRAGKGTGICALFSGPPGTGKTLAAHVIADSLAMDLFQVELSTVVDKYIGETEKNLERVFQEAEAMNAILFFDEADALFGSRSEVRDARDRYANQEIAYLLQRVEQFDGITVLASNLRGNIDPAFARRLHFIISFPDPDEATRARLWDHHLAGLAIDEQDVVDVASLARTVELAGGDIRNIVLSATYSAVAQGGPLGMRHVTAAVRREYIKLGKRVPVVDVDADLTRVGPSRTRSSARDPR